MKKELPKQLVINGVPYEIRETKQEECVYGSDSTTQVINITQGLPYPRQLQYVVVEMTFRLLEAAGLKEKQIQRVYRSVGNVMYRFIRDNDFTFIRDKTYKIPRMLWISGLPYTVDESHNEYLEAKNLGGEVAYDSLTIQLYDGLAQEMKAVILLHEAAHAILYEAATNIETREDIVEPLAYNLYQFFEDNDLGFTKY